MDQLSGIELFQLFYIVSAFQCSRISALEIGVETVDSQLRLHEEDFGRSVSRYRSLMPQHQVTIHASSFPLETQSDSRP